jgi:2-oxoglutarate-Fe(II)-dependent oxygenase superfamily protein
LSRQPKNLLIIDDFVQPERCRDLVAAYEQGMASGRLNPRGALVRDLYLCLVVAGDPGLAAWASKLRDSVGNLLSAHLGLHGLHPEYTAYKCVYAGGAQPLHADNVTAKGKPNHTYWRDATAMLYLNDGVRDFQGGTLRFSRLETEFVPKPGLLVGFGCGLDFEHEVTPVLSGSRHNVALWYTCDPRRREPWSLQEGSGVGGRPLLGFK